MKIFDGLYKFLGKYLINIIILIGALFVPLVIVFFNAHYPDVHHKALFFVFVIFLVIERTWETFFSSKERKGHKLYGDWTLPVVSISYILLVLGTIWEFFVINRSLNMLITTLGVALFLFSFLLRLYGMYTLKEQWSIHAIGAQKVKSVFLVCAGPYKYIRHPIYLGVMIEVLSVPLIWNAYIMCIFTCLVNIPLQVLRAYFEERTTVRKLGEEYIKYKNSVPAFLPFKIK